MKTIKQYYLNVLLFCLFFSSNTILAQSSNNTNKFSFHSFSISPIEVFSGEFTEGASVSGELSFAINRNIFSLSGSTGAELAFFGKADSYSQLNFLYGREFELCSWFYIDTHVGLGLFSYNNHEDPISTNSGLPMVAKIRFKTGQKFSLGLKFQANINSVSNIYSGGLLFQWNY